MKGTIRKLFFGCLVTILLFALSGCGANVSTVLNIDNQFLGERVISCRTTEGDMNDNINGGEAAVDDIISRFCPDVLTSSKSKNGSEVTYTFRLSFDGYEDYKSKVDSLLGRTSEITYSQPSSVFAEGLTLQEDFNSRDLLGWFYNKIVENNLISNPSNLWEDGSTTVFLNGTELATSARIDVFTEIIHPISELNMNTYVEEENAQRVISFTIPSDLYDRKSGEIDAYLESIVPENGLGKWEGTSASGRVFTITYSAPSVDGLAAGSEKIFGEAYLEVSGDDSNPFVSQESYDETISLANFGGRESQIHVVNTYSFPAKGNRSIENMEYGTSQLSKDGQFIEYTTSGYFAGDVTAAFMLIDRVNIEGMDLAASVDQNERASFTASFKFGEDKEGADQIAAYYEKFGDSVDVVRTAQDGERCIVTVLENETYLPDELYDIFGMDSQVIINCEKGFLNNQYTMYLYYNYENLISMTSVDENLVNFSIDLAKYRVKDFQTEYLAEEVEKDLFAFEPIGFAEATVVASKVNFWSVLTLILDGIALIVLLIVIYILLVKKMAAKDHRADVSFKEMLDLYGKPAAAVMKTNIIFVCGVIKEYTCRIALFIWNLDELYYPANANRKLVQYFYGYRLPYKLVSAAIAIVMPVFCILGWIFDMFHAYGLIEKIIPVFILIEIGLMGTALILHIWNRNYRKDPEAEAEYDRLYQEYTTKFRSENGMAYLNLEEEEVSIGAPLNILGPDRTQIEKVSFKRFGRRNILRGIITNSTAVRTVLKRIVRYKRRLITIKGSDGKLRSSCISQNSWYMGEKQLYQYTICYDFCTGDIYKEVSREIFYQDVSEASCSEDLILEQHGKQIEKYCIEIFTIKSGAGILMEGASYSDHKSHRDIIEAAHTIMNLTRSQKEICHQRKCSRRRK